MSDIPAPVDKLAWLQRELAQLALKRLLNEGYLQDTLLLVYKYRETEHPLGGGYKYKFFSSGF